MNESDHKYFVDKLEQRERQLRVYEDIFLQYSEWFHKNKKHLKKVPITMPPSNPLRLRK